MKNNSSASSKVSAQEMMDLVIGIDRKVSAIADRDEKDNNTESKSISKAGTAIAILLMLVGAVIMLCMYVPLLAMLFASFATAWQWICLGYAVVTTIVSGVFRLNAPVRILTVLFAMAPIASILIVSAL